MKRSATFYYTFKPFKTTSIFWHQLFSSRQKGNGITEIINIRNPLTKYVTSFKDFPKHYLIETIPYEFNWSQLIDISFKEFLSSFLILF